MKKRVCVLGLGYIGLPTSVIFADNGWEVTGVDINESVVEQLNNGQVHIEEKGLPDLLTKVVENKSFIAQYIPQKSDVFIITVPTPLNPDGSANLNYVKDAVESIIPVLEKDNIIIIESTIPPRTTRDVVAPILGNAGFDPENDVYLAHCPERVLPGKILYELVENNRIVGGINSLSANKAADVYRTFVNGKIMETSTESAEMSKLMENTYRDVNIALANELTKISNTLGIDTLEVIELANEHPRVNIHQPGPGVGGHCIAIDPYFVMEKDRKNSTLMHTARAINESMPDFVINQVTKLVSKGSKISVLGVAYKGNVDDVRNSPSIDIIEKLINEGYEVNVYDPFVKQNQVNFKLDTIKDTVDSTDLVLILTDHECFKELDWSKFNYGVNNINVLDTKNVLEKIPSNINYYNFGYLPQMSQELQKV